MHFSLENIRKAIAGLKQDLGEGFMQTDLWHSRSLKSVAYNHTRGLLPMYGAVTKHIKIVSVISQMLKKTLVASDYPFSVDYFMINLEDNKVLLILYYNTAKEEFIDPATDQLAGLGEEMSEYQQFILVDMSHTTIGALMGIAIPNMLENIR
jgi:hypothetical protein